MSGCFLRPTTPASLVRSPSWFSFDPRKTSVDDEGIKTIRDAELLSIAVVKAGAQATTIANVKRLYKVRKSSTPPPRVNQKALLKDVDDLFNEFSGNRARGLPKTTRAREIRELIKMAEVDAFEDANRALMAAPIPDIENAKMAVTQAPPAKSDTEPEQIRVSIGKVNYDDSDTVRVLVRPADGDVDDGTVWRPSE
jgi:hypothetical protein